MFVTHGRDVRKEIDPMPGSYHLSLDRLLEEINEIAELRIPGIILFGLPSKKDDLGSEAFHEHGIVQEAVHLIKQAMPNFLVITDVCLCQYTSHGHCGILDNGSIDNDKTIELYARTALSHAQAGADIVAPSGMMDGQVAAIRKHLDREGFKHIPILAYAAKHASAFYGPFRVAADSAPHSGDRRSYQVDPANGRMALREIQAGSGYWSKNGAVQVFGLREPAQGLRVRWPDGSEETYDVRPNTREIVVRPGEGR